MTLVTVLICMMFQILPTGLSTDKCERIGRCCTGYTWDSHSGSCRKCDIGYLGVYCTERCPFPTFGFECQNTCECKEEECDHAYGCRLQDVCTKGFFGPKCEQICPYPTYGQDCQVVCNCTEELCNPIEGCADIFTKIISIESATLLRHQPTIQSDAPLNSTDVYQQTIEKEDLIKNRNLIITVVSINIIFIFFMTTVCIICLVQWRRKRMNNYQTQIAYFQTTTMNKCLPKSSSVSFSNFSNQNILFVREQPEYSSESDHPVTHLEATEASLPFSDHEPYLTPHNKDVNSVYLTVIHD